MKTIALLGCGKAKRDHAAPARALYTGSLFRASLLACSAIAADAIYIVSAQHGLIDLDQELAPYEAHLARQSKRDRESWGMRLVETVAGRHGHHLRLVVYAGDAYAYPIRRAAYYVGGGGRTGVSSITVDEPLRGLELGARLSYLKKQLEEGTTR